METYILINKKTNKYIGIDRSSGGYPFDSDLLGSAKIWYSKTEAKEYAETFPNMEFALHKVSVNNWACSWD